VKAGPGSTLFMTMHSNPLTRPAGSTPDVLMMNESSVHDESHNTKPIPATLAAQQSLMANITSLKTSHTLTGDWTVKTQFLSNNRP